jgi:hypothetical protein
VHLRRRPPPPPPPRPCSTTPGACEPAMPRSVLGASLRRCVKGADSEPRELSLKHVGGGGVVFTMPSLIRKVRSCVFYRKARSCIFFQEGREVGCPRQNSCTDAIRGLKPEVTAGRAEEPKAMCRQKGKGHREGIHTRRRLIGAPKKHLYDLMV